MAGIAGISGLGPGLAGLRVAAEFQAAAVRLQNDAIELQGSLALQLIEAAVITDPAVGTQLDVSV